MTDKQLRHYRALWGDARKALRARGFSASEADAERHAIHVRELGSDKSSLDLDNDEFDKVKAAFLALSQPANLDAQLNLAQGEQKRKRFVIAGCLGKLGKPIAYAEGIAARAGYPRDIARLTVPQLENVIKALRGDIRRAEKRATAPAATTPAPNPDWTV